MAYQTSKPAPNDDLDVSVTDIQQNFLIANTSFGLNHFPFDNATADNGKHKFVEMPIFTATPTPPGAANEGAIYTKTSNSEAALNETDLFYTPDGHPVFSYQLTRTISARAATFGTNTQYTPPANPTVANQVGGWTFLPGGLIMQYGTMLTTGANTTIKYPVKYTTVGKPFSLTVTVKSSVTTYGINNEDESGFIFSSPVAVGTRFYWMSIGK